MWHTGTSVSRSSRRKGTSESVVCDLVHSTPEETLVLVSTGLDRCPFSSTGVKSKYSPKLSWFVLQTERDRTLRVPGLTLDVSPSSLCPKE